MKRADDWRGIRRHGAGWQARVLVNGKRVTMAFPADTPVAHMQDWRATARHRAALETRDAERMLFHFARLGWPAVITLPPIIPGGEYLYFLKMDRFVKIGRSTLPLVRLRDLQCAHPTELRLVAVIPCPDALHLERALHLSFASRRRLGEWFELNWELGAYIELVQRGLVTAENAEAMAVANQRAYKE